MRSAIHLILIASCVLSAFAREESKREFSKTFALPAGRSLRVDNRNGRVSIRTHARPEAQIHVTIRCSAPAADEARRCADAIQIVADEASGAVRTVYPNNWRGDFSYNVDYDITMPATAGLELRNRFGNTDVSNLQASATINSANGSVTFLSGRGRQRIENSFGNVEVRNNDGDVTVNNGNGSVIAADITGAVDVTNRFGNTRVVNPGRGVTIHSNNGAIEAQNVGGTAVISNSFGRVVVTDAKSDVTVQNQNGEIVVNGIAGIADLHTTFASVTVSRIGKALTVRAQNASVRGDTLNESAAVDTTFGSVDLRNVKGSARVTTANSPVRLADIGGEVFAKATFAGVTVTDAGGPITVENQNGSVVVESKAGARCQPVSLRTSFGPIRVTIPRNAGYNLSARTSFGRIHTDPGTSITISGDIAPDVLNGKIGPGGCDLRLMGHNTNIDILTR
jgi:hypothetical protein